MQSSIRIIPLLSLIPVVAALGCMPSASDDIDLRVFADTDEVCPDHQIAALDPDALYPSAPSAQRYMWPGVQSDFHTGAGTPWVGRIVVGMSEQALCYMREDRQLMCAGRVGAQDWGPEFQAVGITNPSQIWLGFDDLCVLAEGRIQCLGENGHGLQGVGHANPTATFIQWGNLSNVAHFISNSVSLCAVTATDQIYCAGAGYSTTPQLQTETGSGVYFDDNGLQTDTSTVWRVVESSFLTPNGMTQWGFNDLYYFGTPGDMVDGGKFMSEGCALNTEGEVLCQELSDWREPGCITTHFTEMPVLALVGESNDGSMCVVYNDGSLSCIGSNDEGKFGTGDADLLPVEAVVQPPGSVYVGDPCQGACEEYEECQAGTCAVPSCGDGIHQAGEACDDGNSSNTDACTNACALASCGDGYVGPQEDCDDGNLENLDSCTNICIWGVRLTVPGDTTLGVGGNPLINPLIDVQVADVKVIPGWHTTSWVYVVIRNVGLATIPAGALEGRFARINGSGTGEETCSSHTAAQIQEAFPPGGVRAGWIPCQALNVMDTCGVGQSRWTNSRIYYQAHPTADDSQWSPSTCK